MQILPPVPPINMMPTTHIASSRLYSWSNRLRHLARTCGAVTESGRVAFDELIEEISRAASAAVAAPESVDVAMVLPERIDVPTAALITLLRVLRNEQMPREAAAGMVLDALHLPACPLDGADFAVAVAEGKPAEFVRAHLDEILAAARIRRLVVGTPA